VTDQPIGETYHQPMDERLSPIAGLLLAITSTLGLA